MKSFEIDERFVAEKIPPRRKDSHKGMNGVVCIVGGGRIYHGAPFLAGMGALRTGVDLVYVAVPAQIAPAVRALSPDLIVYPMPDSKLTRGNANRLAGWLPDGLGCIGVGPGLGPQNPEELAYSLEKLSGKAKGLVADADALRPSMLGVKGNGRMVVTPHAGEFERLFGVKLATELEERVATVKAKAKESQKVVLLKGPTDVVSDGERVGTNNTHSPAMTVGGTGDVLTGITCALIAKGVEEFDAAACALYINGSAGVKAAASSGLHITASDVVANIPAAMRPFDRMV